MEKCRDECLLLLTFEAMSRQNEDGADRFEFDQAIEEGLQRCTIGPEITRGYGQYNKTQFNCSGFPAFEAKRLLKRVKELRSHQDTLPQHKKQPIDQE